jgi:hypothetical protein
MPEQKADQRTEQRPAQHSTDLEAEVSRLRAEVKSMRATLPVSLIPLHGAGPGLEVDDTWSLAEQEAARAEEE